MNVRDGFSFTGPTLEVVHPFIRISSYVMVSDYDSPVRRTLPLAIGQVAQALKFLSTDLVPEANVTDRWYIVTHVEAGRIPSCVDHVERRTFELLSRREVECPNAHICVIVEYTEPAPDAA